MILDDFRLDQQVAVVTGGSRGLGLSAAKALAQAGAHIVNVQRTDNSTQVEAAVAETGRELLTMSLDVAETDAAQRVLDATLARFGRVDILVNNAGIGSSARPMPFTEFTDDFFELTLRTNLIAPFRLCKHAVKKMQTRNYGRIINIASIAGKTGTVHGVAYSASKHGLIGMTRSIAVEFVKHGITCNAVCPGVTKSVMNDKRLNYDAKRLGREFSDVEATSTPLGRRLTPEEIAHFAVSLAVPEASGVTGQMFVIDGGATNL